MSKLTEERIEEEMKKFWKDRACVFDVIPDSCYEDGFIDALKAFNVEGLLHLHEKAERVWEESKDPDAFYSTDHLIDLIDWMGNAIEKLEEKHDE